MDTGRVSEGSMIAAGAGALLLLSLFLSWVGGSAPIEGADGISLSGWESQNTLDIYLFIVALFAIVPALLEMTGGTAEVPFMSAAAGLLLSVIGTILTLYVFLDIPEGADRKIGLWLALLAIIAVTYGQYRAANDEAAGYDRR